MTQYPPRQAVQLVAPSTEPLTLAEVKLFLRIDGDAEDALLNTLTTVAREMAEKYLAKMLITQSWQMKQAYVAGQNIPLSPSPVQSISEVTIEFNGQQSTLDSSEYELAIGDVLALKTQIQADTLSVTMVSGYGAAEDIPGPIRQGVLHCISYLYHHREETASLCPEAKNLWDVYCEVRI